MYRLMRLTMTAAASVALAAPAFAGEINGRGEFLDINGRSQCVYSGLNDTPDGDIATLDPGGRVQNYGYFQSRTWLGEFINPRVVSPREFGPHPGYACNPNSDPPFEIP